MTAPRIAVTHASGLLAEALLEKLDQSGIEPDCLVLLDCEDKAGSRVGYGSTYITALDQYEFDYEGITAILLMEHDAELQDLFQYADCLVVSHIDLGDIEPLYLPRLERPPIFDSKAARIRLAGASISTLMSVLAPVLETVSLSSLNVVYTLSASCFGESGVSELAAQTMDLLNSREVSSSLFPLQLAFNMIPLDDGSHLASELGTLKELQNLPISTQSILVPAFHGMCIAVSLQAEQDIDPQQIEQIFADSEDVQIQQHVASPFTHCREGDKSLIFGLNQQQNDAKKLQFWIIADSVRNGLLKNYQQAIDFLLNSHL